MAERVLRKRRRPISEPVTDQIFIDDVLKTSNTLLTDIFDVVEASFQLSPAFLLSILCNRLRGRLRRLSNQLTREIELVPPDSAPFKRCHMPLLRLREAHQCSGREWRLQ